MKTLNCWRCKREMKHLYDIDVYNEVSSPNGEVVAECVNDECGNRFIPIKISK